MEEIFRVASDILAEADFVGHRLSAKANTRQAQMNILRGFFALTGVLAIVATFMPTFKELLGPKAEVAISLISALLLIISSLAGVFIGHDQPERLRDYSKYIRQHAKEIRMTVTDPQLSDDQKKLRLHELCNLTQANLDDAYNLWVNLETQYERKLERDFMRSNGPH